MRKTKIICTLGPATADETILRNLMLAGMDVARFNFSHGTHESHKKTLQLLTKLREELDLPIAALLDTRGPEIRLGTFKEAKVHLDAGQSFVLRTDDAEGDETGVGISYKNLAQDLHTGSTILLDDGLIELKVTGFTEKKDIICTVCNSGIISSHKGVNVPGVALSIPFISEKDREDIIFGIENGFDFIAASFTRNAKDILQIRKLFKDFNCNTINIIAKIENMQGVENIDEIIRVSDGIMIARGDMGVEVPLEEVPVIQKMIIKKVYTAGKQVITATQMLDSMIKNPRPTRAEATDVANAIYDGTSAIMLSGETAAGAYPVEALETMVKLAERTEADINYIKRFKRLENTNIPDITNAISHATCTTAHDLGASCIITVTKSGRTARMISKFRPLCPIIACTTFPHVRRQLNLSWGIHPLYMEDKSSTDELFDQAVDLAEKEGLVKHGELVVITAGIPLRVSGTTNLLKVHVAGHVLIAGKGIGQKTVRAALRVCKTTTAVKESFRNGEILVIPESNNELLPYLKRAAGVIIEQDGMNSHGAIVALSLDIPMIIGAENATDMLKTGTVVTLDASRGVVSCNQ